MAVWVKKQKASRLRKLVKVVEGVLLSRVSAQEQEPPDSNSAGGVAVEDPLDDDGSGNGSFVVEDPLGEPLDSSSSPSQNPRDKAWSLPVAAGGRGNATDDAAVASPTATLVVAFLASLRLAVRSNVDSLYTSALTSVVYEGLQSVENAPELSTLMKLPEQVRLRSR